MRISDLKKEAAKAASFLTFEIGSNYTRVSKDVPHLRRSIVVYASTQPFRAGLTHFAPTALGKRLKMLCLGDNG
jgi:hypothetical protein